MNLRALYDKLFSKDLGTWIGHGLLGFVIGLVFGPGAVFVAFLYREASDLLDWKFDDRLPRPAAADELEIWPDHAFKKPLGLKLKDGFLDLWAPMVGAALAELLKIAL